MADYLDAPGYYAGAPDTSREAAESVADAAMAREVAALALISALARLGATADEVADRQGWQERYSSRPRLSILSARGQIEDSGKRRRGVSGKLQAVWVLPKYVPTPADTAGGDA